MPDEEQMLDSYNIVSDGIVANVKISRVPSKFVPLYKIALPNIAEGMRAVLTNVRMDMIRTVPQKIQELSEKMSPELKLDFLELITKQLKETVPDMSEETYIYLSATMLHEMFGLGVIEILDADPNLEEIVVNDSKTNVFVYSRKFGWLETNIRIDTEAKIESYAQQIARRVGRQITILNPLLDAQLLNGDRVNATLNPISVHGNTIDLRKFRAEPWTLIDFIKLGTMSAKLVSYVWQAIQYELSIIITGGTASGKTSILNVLLPLIPPNQRIITIEDTNELILPKFLHWVPMITRQPNSEGKGQVTMLDLLVNSLRMRPDRLVVGEIRRKEEAETLFEALMTGHSVYATIHAETAQQVVKRLTTEPINLPEIEVATMDLILVAFRQRRLGIRRVLELAEVVESAVAGRLEVKTNNLFEWRARSDTIERTINASIKLQNKIELYSGLNADEIKADLAEKEMVLDWMVKHNVREVNTLGYAASLYYVDRDKILDIVRRDADPLEMGTPP